MNQDEFVEWINGLGANELLHSLSVLLSPVNGENDVFANPQRLIETIMNCMVVDISSDITTREIDMIVSCLMRTSKGISVNQIRDVATAWQKEKQRVVAWIQFFSGDSEIQLTDGTLTFLSKRNREGDQQIETDCGCSS